MTVSCRAEPPVHSAPTAHLTRLPVADAATFEKFTQAGTGQTAGVWFVKFYAPYVGQDVGALSRARFV